MSGLLAVAAGKPEARLFARAGLRADRLSDDEGFVDLEKYLRLFELTARETRDDLGIHIGRAFNLESLPMLYESRTILDALRALARVVDDHLEGPRVEIDCTPELATLRYRIDLGDPSTRRQHVETVVVIAARALRRLAAGRFRPQVVCFEHPAPRDTREHERIVGAPCRFGEPMTAIQFDALHLRDPVARAPRVSLARSAPQTESWIDRVRQDVARALPDGHPSIGLVAQQLSLSVRTLQRRLVEQGVVYRGLVDDVRRELALGYLADPALSLTELAFLLGYSELSAFDRAFRRWTGTSPGAFRASRRS